MMIDIYLNQSHFICLSIMIDRESFSKYTNVISQAKNTSLVIYGRKNSFSREALQRVKMLKFFSLSDWLRLNSPLLSHWTCHVWWASFSAACNGLYQWLQSSNFVVYYFFLNFVPDFLNYLIGVPINLVKFFVLFARAF